MIRTAPHRLLVAFFLFVGAGCSSRDQNVAPLRSVVAPGTSATDVSSTSGVNPNTISTSGAQSTNSSSSVPRTPTTSQPVGSAASCTFESIHADTGPPPSGITDIDLRCQGEWASWIGRANDPTTSDGYSAVARKDATGWHTVNLGTAGVCADGGVPEELWTALNCGE